MTESEWLTCTDPTPMIRFLELGRRGSCRKLRLFGAACCRRVFPFVNDERTRQVVETAEDYADGRIGAPALRVAHRRSCTLCEAYHSSPNPSSPRSVNVLANLAVAVNWVSAEDASFRTDDHMNGLVPGGYNAAAAGYIAHAAGDAIFYGTYEGTDAFELVGRRNVEFLPTPADHIWAAEQEVQSGLLRCVFGNPFRTFAADPAWLAWNDGTAVRLAEAAYEDRDLPSGYLDPTRLSVLADVLEDAGCAEAALLDYFRSPGPHVRGCWAVDVLLGKE
jgi:hypothetical protein